MNTLRYEPSTSKPRSFDRFDDDAPGDDLAGAGGKRSATAAERAFLSMPRDEFLAACEINRPSLLETMQADRVERAAIFDGVVKALDDAGFVPIVLEGGILSISINCQVLEVSFSSFPIWKGISRHVPR